MTTTRSSRQRGPRRAGQSEPEDGLPAFDRLGDDADDGHAWGRGARPVRVQRTPDGHARSTPGRCTSSCGTRLPEPSSRVPLALNRPRSPEVPTFTTRNLTFTVPAQGNGTGTVQRLAEPAGSSHQRHRGDRGPRIRSGWRIWRRYKGDSCGNRRQASTTCSARLRSRRGRFSFTR